MITLADVFRRHWSAYEEDHPVLPSHRRAVSAILSCRTAQRGGHLFTCAQCQRSHFAYHSCHHRACPQCGSMAKAAWLSKQLPRLLPVPYFLVTFTVPEELRPTFRAHQRKFYHAFFAQSSATLQEVATKKLKGQLGFLGLLQTWTRQLIYHPHIHYLVPGGALSSNRLRWIRLKAPAFLLPQKVLARRFRQRFKLWLQSLKPPIPIPPKIWAKEWVVDVQPVGSGKKALEYLATYLHRTALGPDRLVQLSGEQIGLRYRDRESGKSRLLALTPVELIRRFLQHILPRGFQRLRSYGWISPAAKFNWQRILALLDWKQPVPPPLPEKPIPRCPVCQCPMVWVSQLPRAPP